MRLRRVLERFGRLVEACSRFASDGRRVDTEQMRHRRELARSENQAGHNLTVQTTIDMARTQTWTGGG